MFECNQKLQRFLLILNSFHLSLMAAQREMFNTGCSIKLCNTACSTVHKNVPNVVLVLCCWVTGNETRAGSDRLLHFLLLTEPSTTYAVLRWFLLFLFLSRFTSSYVSSLVQVVLNLLLRYSKIEYIDNGWKMFSVILFRHFYVPMNVILKDTHPIHICNCLNACSFVSHPCFTVKPKTLYIKSKLFL